MRDLLSGLLIHWRLLINRLLTSAFVPVNIIIFDKSNGLMIKCLMFNSMFDELIRVKYFKEITDFIGLIM